MKKLGALILITVMILAVFTGCSNSGTVSVASATYQPLIDNYGDQLPLYLDRQYYFDGQPVSIPETNFYFINAFFDLSTYAMYGYFPATAKGYIDLSAECPEEGYTTYGDYFVKYAENSLESTCILIARAEAEGVTLSEESKASIESSLTEMRTNKAATAGLTLDEYLQSYYGPGNDEATFKQILERYYLADEYSRYYCSKPENNAEGQAAKEAALAAANSMKDQCTTIDDLTGLAQAAQQAGDVLDQGDIAVPKGQMVPKFEEWAYEEGRTVGELDVIYAPEYGYFVVGYLGVDDSTGVPNVRYALFYAPENDDSALEALSKELLQEIDEKKHDFHYTQATVSSMTTTDVLIVVFLTLAGVCIVAVVIILIAYAMKKNKGGASRAKSSSKPSNSKNKQANKPKPSKPSQKQEEEEDEDDEDEEYDEDDEDDEDEEEEDDE